ncbi:proteasome component M29 [Lecanora helva]
MVGSETSEARELSLVGKVEMKIAMCSNDSKLESVLDTYLPPLLLKLASDFLSVRNKVINVCQHVNTRIKPPSIKLPVVALLKQCKENQNSLVRHFDLLYIQQGIDRLPLSARLDLLPNIINGLDENYRESTANAATLFNVFLRLLHSMTFPPRGDRDDLALRDKLGLVERPADASFVATWLGKLMLFAVVEPNGTRCPGLSKAEYNFLKLYGRKETWMPNAAGGLNLAETKVLASKFLASGAFVDSERFLPALFASADANSRISEVGDDILKRAFSAVSFEDPGLIKQLYEIYLGNRGPEGSLPARVPLRNKILSILCRSKLACSFVPQSTQIIQEALAPLGNATQDQETSTAKQGLETTKLRGQVFAFTNWLARMSSPAEISVFAPTLVGELRGYIENQGWPHMNTDTLVPIGGELLSRAYGYESIGLLAAACPKHLLHDPDLDLLRWMFTSLNEDFSGKEIPASIEQAFSSVLGAMNRNLDGELQMSLTSLLSHYMNGSNGNSDAPAAKRTRYLVVRFANRCLPFSNTAARWINVCALQGDADDRSAVREEGRKGLDPYWFQLLNPIKEDPGGEEGRFDKMKYKFPAFAALVDRFFGPSSIWNVSSSVHTTNKKAYIAALRFCRCVLFHQALEAVARLPVIDADWERNIDALIENDEEARAKLRGYFRSLSSTSDEALTNPRVFNLYLKAAFHGLFFEDGDNANVAGGYLSEVASLSSSNMYAELSHSVSSLMTPIFSMNHALRDKSSRIFGIVSSLEECSQDTIQKMLRTFEEKLSTWRQAVGSEVLQVHGAILALSSFISRSWLRNTRLPDFEKLRPLLITYNYDILSDSRDKILVDAVLLSISESALYGVLTPDTVPESYDLSGLVQKMAQKATEGNERAIAALGNLGLQANEDGTESAILSNIVERLYELHTIRRPETHFAVGTALSCVAIGWHSKALIAALDVECSTPLSPRRQIIPSMILNHVLSDCKSTKPALRQASVIWLLSLVQYCGHHHDIKDRLRDCQVAFKGYLADRDSLNQETASRGLTLIYEKGSRALKDELIRDLVGSFTDTKAHLSGTVSEDTELFEPGALPTGDGSITTYKDIMSLASEIGDSSLVYKFMSLASNNAIWSSRAAFGRFGLSNVLNDASTEGYLAQNPKLYPALFRYRFDPNTNVRNAMNEIWSALVKEPTKTVDDNFDTIVKDLLKNILGKEWRTRQASCAAIADLVQGRRLEKYESFLTEIWEVTFKVCDDIKESVRTAAMALARVLTGILTRGLESGESSAQSSEKMLKHVLPFLLSPAGLESGAPDVQEFARKTLLDIIKSSHGRILRPFVPNLIGRLLALLSSIEPEMINYLHLNADKYGLSAQELDDARLKHIRGSTMLEAIERCLDFLDESSMPELQQKLEEAIKTVVGLPSKVGCSRVLVSLSTRQNFIFKPYANHFLPLARKQVFDRNDTISSSYAAACGYLTRLTTDEVLLQLVKSCQKFYFDSDDERRRVIAGDILHAVSKHATDRFKSFSSDLLPFVFVAKHDTYDRARTFFEDTWNDNVAGTRTVLLYVKEIIELASQHLDSAQWPIKHTSAFAIADVVRSCGSNISDTNAKLIWPALNTALAGKTWDGKEKVLKALIQYAKNSTYWSTESSIAEQVEKIVLREAKRNNVVFRQYALESLADFVELRKDVDMYPQTNAAVIPIIEEALESSEDMDVDSKSGGPSSKSITESTLANAATALVKSINPSSTSSEDLNSQMKHTFEISNRIMTENRSRKTIETIYDAEKHLFDNLSKANQSALSSPLEDVLIEYTKQIFSAVDQVEMTRIKAAEAAVAMAPLVRRGERIQAVFVQGLAAAKDAERSPSVRQILDRAGKLVEG